MRVKPLLPSGRSITLPPTSGVDFTTSGEPADSARASLACVLSPASIAATAVRHLRMSCDSRVHHRLLFGYLDDWVALACVVDIHKLRRGNHNGINSRR